MTRTRRVEYYRLWGGDSGTWDTDFIDIPADTPDGMVDKAIRKAAEKIKWRDEVPVLVGLYCDADEEEDDADEGREPICGECHSDDRVYSASFNARPWFEQAQDDDILQLAQEDWGDGYAADEVGMSMADSVADVQKMFEYLEHHNQAHKEHIGWVCTVDKDDVLQWLKAHRPQLYQRVLKIEEGVDL